MKYLLRLMVFVLRNIVLILVVGVLLVISFTFAMDASNVYIVANDGMKLRAQVVLGLQEPAELMKFFTTDALERDMLLRNTEYLDYTVRGCDYRVNVDWLWTWPWDTRAEVTLTEHIVAIDGELPISKQTEEQLKNPNKIPPPAWQDARYSLTFIKIDGRWKINDVQTLELIESLPTRTPQLTVAPSPTPTASAMTPTATPAPKPPGTSGTDTP